MKLQASRTTPLGYACIRRQTTRLRNMNADISRSLLQSKNSVGLHCCRPLAYVTVGRL